MRGQDEVADILDEANAHPDRFSWKLLTATSFKEIYPALHGLSAEAIGKALDRAGVQLADTTRVDGKRGRYRLLPVPRA